MYKTKLYSIVEFEGGLELIPSKWLTEDEKSCYFPLYNTLRRVQKATKHLEEPAENWKLYPVKRIFATSDTYNRGMEKCKKAEYESEDFSSTDFESSQNNIDHNNIGMKYPTVPPSLLNNNEAEVQTSIGESPNIAGKSVETLCRQVANLKYAVNELLANQDLILKKLDRLATKTNEEEEMPNVVLPKLPINTNEELGQFEDKLDDQNIRKTLISDLGKIGGCHINEIVRRIMTYLLTDELAADFSCYGMKKKKAFTTLKTFDVVAEVVHVQLSKVTNKDVTKPLSSWLGHARERVEKRNKI